MAGRKQQRTRDEQAGVTPLHGRRPGGRSGPHGQRSSGLREDGTFEPEFEGQREPFRPGNKAALVHGARDEDSLRPLAQQIFTRLLEDPQMPDHVRSAAFVMEGAAWSRAEAAAALIWDHVASMGVDAATRLDPGRARSLLDIWIAAEKLAGRGRDKMGLNPSAYAKISKDLGIAAKAGEDALESMASRGAQITATRLEIEGGDAPA